MALFRSFHDPFTFYTFVTLTLWLQEPGGSMPHSQGSPIIPILSRINQFLVLKSISLRSILILSSHLRLRLPQGIFPVGVPVKILKELLPSGYMTYPSQFCTLDHPDYEWYKLWNSSLWSLLHSLFASLLGPNIRLRILFSNTLSLDSSLNVRDYVSQPYSTTDNIIVLYILTFKFSRD